MRFSRLRIRLHRRLAAAAVVALLSAATILALIPLHGAAAGIGDTFDSLLRNLITAGVLGALAYLWYFAWVSDRATQDLLEAAQRDPGHLFLHRRELGTSAEVVGRDSLVEELRTNLTPEFNTGPQILVGDTGSGKTSLLLALATRLAEREVLPVVISLRDSGNGSGHLDFRDLAKARFSELVDPHVKTDADADKLWRWMCRKGQVAILADDLDRCPAAVADGHKSELRVALETARRRQLPIVLATRPAGLPLDLPNPPIDLSQRPLELDHAGYTRILREAGRRDDDAAEGEAEPRELVEANVMAGNLTENAFYIDLVTRLLRQHALELPRGNGKHAVRIELLDAWRDVLCGKGQVSERDLEHRDEMLRLVEGLALAWLDPEVRRNPDEERAAVRAGERLDLLYLDEQVVPRFRNEVLHAYFASRAIEPSSADWHATLERAQDSPRVQLALVCAAAAGRDEVFCRRSCEKLLEAFDGADADQKLLRAAAAAEIVRAGGFEGLDDKIARRCIAARPDAGPVAKRAALDQVALLGGSAAIEALWAFGRDPDYGTRWKAVEMLAQRCTSAKTEDGQRHRNPAGLDAYRVLEPEVQGALEAAARMQEKGLDDWHEAIVALKQLAWMLPPLCRSAGPRELRELVDRQLANLICLEQGRITEQRGLEASIAQGFKAAARLSPEGPIPRDAKKLLHEAEFWYSQLNLMHGIALQMAALPAYGRKDLESLVGTPRAEDLHPLLRYATRLCCEAMDAPAGKERVKAMNRVVWDDEGAVTSGRAVDLTPEATQLVGEITLLLNLNETGDPSQRERFGTDNRMPYCLQGSEDRLELSSGCDSSCDFHLCPFHPVRDRPSAHRELSSNFCRWQSRNADADVAKQWGSRVKQRALAELWERLERQARF